MAEGGHDVDDVFIDDDYSDQSLITYPESMAHELLQSESTLSPVSAHSPLPDSKLKMLKDKVNSFYRNKGLNPDLIDYNRFTMNDNGDLFFIKNKKNKIQLTHRNDPSKFLSLDTLRTKLGSVSDVRNLLSLSEYKSRSKLSSRAVSSLHETQRKLPANVEEIPLLELPQTASETIDELETSFALQTINDPPPPMREILALNESLRSIRGELVNNLAKLSELDTQIEHEKQKLADADADPTIDKREIERRLKNLQEEREARLEVLSFNRNQLRSQVSRIRETIQTILHEDTTLMERLRTLFREQGITIFSVLTAIGMTISTVV